MVPFQRHDQQFHKFEKKLYNFHTLFEIQENGQFISPRIISKKIYMEQKIQQEQTW